MQNSWGELSETPEREQTGGSPSRPPSRRPLAHPVLLHGLLGETTFFVLVARAGCFTPGWLAAQRVAAAPPNRAGGTGERPLGQLEGPPRAEGILGVAAK